MRSSSQGSSGFVSTGPRPTSAALSSSMPTNRTDMTSLDEQTFFTSSGLTDRDQKKKIRQRPASSSNFKDSRSASRARLGILSKPRAQSAMKMPKSAAMRSRLSQSASVPALEEHSYRSMKSTGRSSLLAGGIRGEPDSFFDAIDSGRVVKQPTTSLQMH